MSAINPTIQLAKIRSKIDIQQQVIQFLELELQQAILGDNNGQSLQDVVNNVFGIYNQSTDGAILSESFAFAFEENDAYSGQLGSPIEQDAIRQMLYQARALLGELRIEEQAWNQEVIAQKNANKELIEQAKA